MKPVVVVSRCLGFDACRYDASRLDEPFVAKLASFVEFRTVCPEADIGMGSPRPPVRLVSGNGNVRLLEPATRKDFTEPMERFGIRFLDGLDEVDGFLLKSRSPSCAVRDSKVYPDRENVPPLTRAPGIFGRAVLERFPAAAIEDEGRLRNFRIREHFLTKLFSLARLRAARTTKESLGPLVQFHAEHKLLLMAYSQKHLRLLGTLVANHEKRPAGDVWSRYAALFSEALARPSRYQSNVNVLMHALGYFSKGLTAREKAHFLSTLESYREGKTPLSATVSILHSWLARFDEPYLEQQIFFEPYPSSLVEITDSGKGREGKGKGPNR